MPLDNATSTGFGDCHDSRLRPGSEHPWPDGAASEPDLALLDGEIALIGVLRTAEGVLLRRRSLGCWEAPCLLPALLDLPEGLELRFKVIRAASVLPLRGTALQRTDGQGCPPVTLPPMEELLRQLAPPPPPSPGSQSPSLSPAQPSPAGEGSLGILVHWLAQRHGTRAIPLTHPPAAPLDRLRALLECAGMIGVPLRLEPADLDRDCGDLILFGPAGPLLLVSEPRGYWLRDPAAPARPARRWRRSDLDPATAPWQALGVSPSLGAHDVSAAALLRFCLGPAPQPAAMLIACTGLGLAMGFLLAIGQEGGAARWIFSLGGGGGPGRFCPGPAQPSPAAGPDHRPAGHPAGSADSHLQHPAHQPGPSRPRSQLDAADGGPTAGGRPGRHGPALERLQHSHLRAATGGASPAAGRAAPAAEAATLLLSAVPGRRSGPAFRGLRQAAGRDPLTP